MDSNEDNSHPNFSFGRLDSALGFLLLAGWRAANREFTAHFTGIDITPAGYGVLLLVQENPGCSIGELGRAMGITPNNIARLVDRLREQGLITKAVSSADSRVRAVSLTDDGAEFVALLNERHAAYEKEFCDQVGQDRVDALCALLRPFLARD